MNIPREEQIKFANDLLPIVDHASDPQTVARLHNIAALVLKWSGFDNNDVAFDLSEYTYELLEIARGKEDSGWKDEARRSLDRQLIIE